MYGLQGPTKETISTSPFETIHSSCTNQINLTHQPRVTYAQITKQNSYAATNIGQDQHINQLLQQISDIQDLKNMMKSLFEEMETMLNLPTTVLTKLK
jgi:hypothetical protein